MFISPPRQSRVSMYTLSEGKRGILETVALMRQLVEEYKTDPEIRRLALHLVEHIPPKNGAEEIRAIFNFVRDQIRYVGDVWEIETVHTPVELLKTRQGDCDDKSVLLATLLESIGYETAFKVTGYHGRDYEHVYVFARGFDVAAHLDPTEPHDAGWEAPNPTVEMYVQ